MSGEGHRDYLSLRGLTKRFGTVAAADGISLNLARGEVLALLGPSGSGKTTTLRLLAGFEAPDSGAIVVDGEDVTRVPPSERRFGMVFQHYALFPHLDVGENIAFGLESRGEPPDQIRAKVTEALRLVELEGYQRRGISELSGGQQQRVALARALAPEPRVLLLDEPLSNLDPNLRERTRRELRHLIHRVGITTVIVTHEQEEAFDLGDVVAVLHRGRVEQVAPPDELYLQPVNRFVAGFVGRSSALEVMLLDSAAGRARLKIGEVEWTVPMATPPMPNGPALLLLRPEALHLGPIGAPALPGRVAERRFIGAQASYLIALAGGGSVEVAAPVGAAREGDPVGVLPGDRGFHLFPREQA